MLKSVILFFTVLCSFQVFSQQINSHEKRRLDKFSISLDSIDRTNELDVLNLQALVKSDLQCRRRKRAGFIFAGAGALLTTLGIMTVANNDAEGEGKAYGSVIGGTVIAVGVISAGVSIPFFISAKKRKRQRESLIAKLKE